MPSHYIGKLLGYPVGRLVRVDVEGTALCVGRTRNGVYAVADKCSHEGASLSEGDLIENDVLCPMHNSRFDLATGAVKGLPAREPVASYAISVVDDDVFVEM